ncbi:hypothetical protein HOB10_03120 [Candidatus Parcubacteria bacterium]|jgi:hypothetical protein|nr:hypothetical protein [Candidatus Parcubacteria bacterium]
MFSYLIPFVNPLVILTGLLLFFYNQEGIFWLLGVSLLTILLSGRIVSKKLFWRHKLLWVNLITAYVSQLLFLLVLTSGNIRYLLAFALSIIWGVIWWLLGIYFKRIENINSKEYLSYNIFFYTLSFWFLSSSLYALIVFLNWPVVLTLLVLLIVVFLWTKEIFDQTDDVGRLYVFFAMFILAQLVVVLYFLPASFYIAGAIASLWFFFIIDSTINKSRDFRLYLSLFLASFAVLIAIAII